MQVESLSRRRFSSAVIAWCRRVGTLVAASLLMAPAAAGQALPGSAPSEAESLVQTYLQGRITVNPEVDSTRDYRGFEVLVLRQAAEGRLDTLGYAVTDVQGHFATGVVAPARGIYPLVVRRRGTTVAATDYVVAEGDSARLEVELPLRRPLHIRSTENAAWTAYQNTMALHREGLIRSLQDTTDAAGAMEAQIRQTAHVLWSMRTTYPNTLGAAQGAVESISLLEGWNDSLVVARAREIEPSNPRFVESARLARRAEARRSGQAAALALLRDFRERAISPAQKAALHAEIVQAHIDSLEQEEALAAARQLAQEYPGTPWAAWAERAEYEVENLLPGMPAPTFEATTWAGEPFDLGALAGRPVVLEFYQPADELYQGQLAARKALYDATRAVDLALVSVSFQPDTLLNEAFFEGRDLPGTHIVATTEQARALVETYNIGALPTRLLVDADGTIVGKYVGSAFAALQEEVRRLMEADASAQ